MEGLVRTAVQKALESPEIKNETNKEAPVQSRVVVGSTAGVFSMLAVVLTELTTSKFPNYNWALLMPALGGLWGSAYALYGRLYGGLKPLFAKWF